MILKQLKTLFTMRKVEMSEIGSMLRHVNREYGIPGYKYKALAKAITLEYNVICTKRDILNYEALHVEEDYELEERRAGYDI